MCDYSLENKISRAAEVGDKLVTCSFPMTPTRGFCAEKEPGIAVCLLPGTELAFEGPIRHSGLWGLIVDRVRARLGYTLDDGTVARFRQVDLNNPHTHHDSIELADGRIIKLTMLQVGQRARVLQLPATGEHAGRPAMAKMLRKAVERHEDELMAVR
ncbi:hypothetical protein [Aestuariivirga sp.]|uniref:hypothetical protein n=1 Tax=Aestuariivirga sp. TaxID=2650926 RepID=UPI0035943762